MAQYAARIATMVEQLKLGGTNITWAKRRTVLMKGLRPEYASIRSQLDIAYRTRRENATFDIREADRSIRTVEIVKTPIDEKIEYDDLVDQLKAEEVRLGLNVYGLGQKNRQTAFLSNGQNRKFQGRNSKSMPYQLSSATMEAPTIGSSTQV
ncbi:hypothetical protein BCV70DRAFT_218350 [Testicularia cyperi]|uniref:Uncharacterized protein n=1 Tax=Testicularia cyperi TaxID=1882483 RepID=A0A317XLA4_9BASI|nr:hypothetical protein BCV70DRAFT_218350 [Testicularia cyperi]